MVLDVYILGSFHAFFLQKIMTETRTLAQEIADIKEQMASCTSRDREIMGPIPRLSSIIKALEIKLKRARYALEHIIQSPDYLKKTWPDEDLVVVRVALDASSLEEPLP